MGFASAISASTACAMGLTAGGLHGVSMAIRKHYGEGKAEYWKDCRWWMGVILDLVGGSIFLCASPFVAPEVFLALSVGAQMSVGFILGVCYFGEDAWLAGKIGFACTLCGSVMLAFCEHHETVILSPADFLLKVCTVDFLIVVGSWIAFTLFLFLVSWALNWDKPRTSLSTRLLLPLLRA